MAGRRRRERAWRNPSEARERISRGLASTRPLGVRGPDGPGCPGFGMGTALPTEPRIPTPRCAARARAGAAVRSSASSARATSPELLGLGARAWRLLSREDVVESISS
jgi:hypothetical protein